MATKMADNRIHTVSLERPVYEAFLAREESYQQMAADLARIKNINLNLTDVCNAQVKRLSMNELRAMSLEGISQLQQLFVDMLRDGTKVAALEDVSEFWRLWEIHTKKGLDARKFTREEIDKYEPDIFRSWRNWVNDAGKAGRTFNEAGSRTERDDATPGTAREMQEHIIVHLRQDNAKLTQRMQQLEAEMEAFKAEKKTKEKR